MCLPAIVGIATGILGAVQSIAQFQSQSAAAAASEQAYQQKRDLNQQAANRAYQQTQLKLKGEMDRASQQAEQLLTQRLQAQGAILASGRTGSSIGALLTDAQRSEGKDLASLGMNLAYATQDYYFGMENILQQQTTANVNAASQRIAAPSVGGLVLGLAGAGLSGLSAYASLKAPSPGEKPPVPEPTPGNWSSSGLGSSQFQPTAPSIYKFD
jgi:hypothetical protein